MTSRRYGCWRYRVCANSRNAAGPGLSSWAASSSSRRRRARSTSSAARRHRRQRGAIGAQVALHGGADLAGAGGAHAGEVVALADRIAGGDLPPAELAGDAGRGLELEDVLDLDRGAGAIELGVV